MLHKFLCDQMVSRIGKWLRASGYDTVIIHEPLKDRQILDMAIAENRLLITRDRHFLTMKRALPCLLYLASNDFNDCMQELIRLIEINWLLTPFSRCLNCNTLLEIPEAEAVNENVPLKIRVEKSSFWYCPSCDQYFWNGSHTGRMINQLAKWQDLSKRLRHG